MNIKGSKKKNQVLSVNIFEQQGIIAKADAIKAGLKASTWHELETKCKNVLLCRAVYLCGSTHYEALTNDLSIQAI